MTKYMVLNKNGNLVGTIADFGYEFKHDSKQCQHVFYPQRNALCKFFAPFGYCSAWLKTRSYRAFSITEQQFDLFQGAEDTGETF